MNIYTSAMKQNKIAAETTNISSEEPVYLYRHEVVLQLRLRLERQL